MKKEFTTKQIEKYKRRKYLSALNKCTTNLYKIFKNNSTSYESYKNKFIDLKKEIEKYEDTIVNTEYIKRIKEYINNLYTLTITNEIDEKEFKNLKITEIPKLNNFQKMKRKNKYSKEKYKNF